MQMNCPLYLHNLLNDVNLDVNILYESCVCACACLNNDPGDERFASDDRNGLNPLINYDTKP